MFRNDASDVCVSWMKRASNDSLHEHDEIWSSDWRKHLSNDAEKSFGCLSHTHTHSATWCIAHSHEYCDLLSFIHYLSVRFIELRDERVVPAARCSVHPRLTHVLCLSGVVDGRSFCSSWHTPFITITHADMLITWIWVCFHDHIHHLILFCCNEFNRLTENRNFNWISTPAITSDTFSNINVFMGRALREEVMSSLLQEKCLLWSVRAESRLGVSIDNRGVGEGIGCRLIATYTKYKILYNNNNHNNSNHINNDKVLVLNQSFTITRHNHTTTSNKRAMGAGSKAVMWRRRGLDNAVFGQIAELHVSERLPWAHNGDICHGTKRRC